MEDHQDSSSSSFFLSEDKHALFARLLTSPFSSDHHVYKIASPIPLGFGTNGTVFSVQDENGNIHAAKVHAHANDGYKWKALILDKEWRTMRHLLQHDFTDIPQPIDYMHVADDSLVKGGVEILVMEQYDASLQDLHTLGIALTPDLFLDIARRLLIIITKLHALDMINQDIKPANILVRVGRPDSIKTIETLVLVDFLNVNEQKHNLGKRMYGGYTPTFCSIGTHQRKEYTLADEMETLGYTLLALLCKDCSLPWKEKPFVAQKQDKLALRMHGTFYGDYLDPSFEFLKDKIVDYLRCLETTKPIYNLERALACLEKK